MINQRQLSQAHVTSQAQRAIGTPGYLVILAWSFCLILLSPPSIAPFTLGLCVLITLVLYPAAFRRLLSWRWLLLLGGLILANVFWVGEPEIWVWGAIPVSISGLKSGLGMAIRAMVILLSVDGFASVVDISEIAGLIERLGLHGLGFSIGIAFNLLPSLRQSSSTVWRSLSMRGGLRRERWQGLKLFFVTVMVSALRRAEEIALAAESRAFTPEKARAMPIKHGKYDNLILALACFLALGFIFLAIKIG